MLFLERSCPISGFHGKIEMKKSYEIGDVLIDERWNIAGRVTEIDWLDDLKATSWFDKVTRGDCLLAGHFSYDRWRNEEIIMRVFPEEQWSIIENSIIERNHEVSQIWRREGLQIWLISIRRDLPEYFGRFCSIVDFPANREVIAIEPETGRALIQKIGKHGLKMLEEIEMEPIPSMLDPVKNELDLMVIDKILTDRFPEIWLPWDEDQDEDACGSCSIKSQEKEEQHDHSSSL